MRIVIISDTHGNAPFALSTLDGLVAPDLLIHLGDGCDDARLLRDALGWPTLMVAGNCDTDPALPAERLLEYAGHRLLVTHGDRHYVKGGLSRLCQHAARQNARIVLFGHTHEPFCQEEQGCLFVNPGSLARNCSSPSYAILDLHGEQPLVTHVAAAPLI